MSTRGFTNFGGVLALVLLVATGAMSAAPARWTHRDSEYLRSMAETMAASGGAQAVWMEARVRALLGDRTDPRLAVERGRACSLLQGVMETASRDWRAKGALDDMLAASGGALLHGDCAVAWSEDIKHQLVSQIEQVDGMDRLYKIVQVLANAGEQVDSQSVKRAMERLLKRDSGARSQGWSYMVAALLWRDSPDQLGRYVAEIEDTVQQADEADNAHLYYEEGAQATAEIVRAMAELCRVAGRPVPVAREKLAKFGAYLVSRRHSRQLRVALAVAEAIRALSRVSNAVVTAAVDKEAVSLAGEPFALVSLANLWGEPVDGAALQADTVKHARTGATVMTRQPLTPLGAGVYRLDLSGARAQLEPGLLSVQLSGSTRTPAAAAAAAANDTADKDRAGAPISAALALKVVTTVALDGVELSVRERDQIAGALSYKLAQGGAPLSERLAISWLHRLELRFSVSARAVLAPHQVFLRMTHAATGQQITFVVEPERGTGVYRFTLDLEKSSKDFDNVSGDYKMELLVGDAVLERPLYWLLAVIKLDMPGSPAGTAAGAEAADNSRRSVAGSRRASAASNPRVGAGPSVAKPQIFHQFRPAEKRGGHVISLVFTVLCTVPPAVIMLALWYAVGLNVSNFQLSASGLLFHGGVCAIFALYYCYWSFMDMFSTLQVLAPLGALTAFFGNRVLRQIALQRKEAQTQQ